MASSAASSSAPAIQLVLKSMSRLAPSGISRSTVMSAICIRPPGRDTLKISANTRSLSGERVHNPVGDHQVGPSVGNRQRLHETVSKLKVLEIQLRLCSVRPVEHRRGHVHADDVAGRAHRTGSNDRVDSRPGTDIDDILAVDGETHEERVPHARN